MRAWDQAKCNGGSGAFYGTGYPVSRKQLYAVL